MTRNAVIDRKTSETSIHLELSLDGEGKNQLATGVGFLDHMLDLMSRHALFNLSVQAAGDLHIDDHHTVEDIGICLGQALADAVGDKRGIYRYGHMTLPMDETLATVALDLSGRSAFVWKVDLPPQKIGTFDSALAEEFWCAVSRSARMNLHVLLHHGGNAHHVLEAIFKAAGRALRQAVATDPRAAGMVPSTKGSL